MFIYIGDNKPGNVYLHRNVYIMYFYTNKKMFPPFPFLHMSWRITLNSMLPFSLYEQIHKLVQYLHTFETCVKHHNEESSISIYDYNYDFPCYFITKGENITH